jgi:hypothetical protein
MICGIFLLRREGRKELVKEEYVIKLHILCQQLK